MAALVVLGLIIGGTINLGGWGDSGLPTMTQELVDGPYDSDDVSDGHGISHSSYVYYTKETDPFVAEVDRIHYGAREKEEEPLQSQSGWRRYKTEYKEWDGDSWNRVKKLKSSPWRETGYDSLDWWNVSNDVTLEGGALVKQQIQYRFFVFLGGEFTWAGAMHDHYLE